MTVRSAWEKHQFQASQGYMLRSCLKERKKIKEVVHGQALETRQKVNQ